MRMISNALPIKFLHDITIEDQISIGKSISVLSRFLQERLSVPTGFVLSKYIFIKYLDLTSLRDYYKNSRKDKNIDHLYDAFEATHLPDELRYLIGNYYSKISGFSDAFVNIRGIIIDSDSNEISHRTYQAYEVRGLSNVLNEIENLYKEIVIENKNAIEKFFSGELNIVILIQKSVQTEASGLMYTTDIITKDNSKLTIEALYGIEAGASLEGLVPDQYIFDKNSNKIVEKHISTQEKMIVRQTGSSKTTQTIKISPAWQKRQKIDDKHINILAKTGLLIEEELNESQLVSWSFEAGKIWLTFVESLNKKSFSASNTSKDMQIKINEQVSKIPMQNEEEMATNSEESNKNILFDNYIHKEILNNEKEEMQSIKSANANISKEPLLEGEFYIGEEIIGQITFDSENANINNILVLKGDEDISSNLKVAGFIIEESSELLAKRLNEYFQNTVITGVPLAMRILREGETMKIDGNTGRIYELINDTEELTTETDFESKFSLNPPQLSQSVEMLPINSEEIDLDSNMQAQIEPKASVAQVSFYEDDKVTIEKTPLPQTNIVIANKINFHNESVDKLLTLVNENSANEIKEVENASADIQNEEVKGLNPNDQIRVWGDSLEKIIKASKKVETSSALEALEHVVDTAKDVIEESKEFAFDQDENYISQITHDLNPKKSKYIEFIPTATKVYVHIIDEVVDEELENYDGLVFTSTMEPEIFFQLLEQNIERANDKEIIVISPPYEEEALLKFFKTIHKIRSKGNRNISLILPDYRNKKELAEFKKLLSVAGLRRSSTFEIFANLSRTMNVFRSNELTSDIVDGSYIDLFRLKMNMLGVEKLTASTRYVEGMKNLVKFLHNNIELEGRSLINISGFAEPKKVLKDILNYKFWGIICDLYSADQTKKIISSIEQKAVENIFNTKKKAKRF
jgi:phosphohistidine swiveling domain-containing protein